MWFKKKPKKIVSSNVDVTMKSTGTVFLDQTNMYKIKVAGVDYVSCNNIKCNLIWPVGKFVMCPGCRRPL